MQKKNYARDINAMTDDELEQFVDSWMSRKVNSYTSTERFSGAGDMGRDVVGYYTTRRHEGPWDNYQCKQLGRALTEAAAITELGKVFYYSSLGAFNLPQRYVFVSPRGVGRSLRELIAHPDRLKKTVIDKWDDYCAKRITETGCIALGPGILPLVQQFDFAHVDALDAGKMLKDPHITATLVEWFGADPGDAPRGVVPAEIQAEESPFIEQLIEAYRERTGSHMTEAREALEHAQYGEHLRLQRTRYFDAASFKRHYRDNTPREYLDAFQDDVFNGVIDTHRDNHRDTLTRVDQVMSQAARVAPSGVLARYGRVTVKQGICHHFVNEGRLKWKR